jgi:DNA-binding CsgD family transcriptional regulator
MYTKEEHWTFAMNWVNGKKCTIISHITRLLAAHNLPVIDSDDCIHTAYEVAFSAHCLCCERDEKNQFHGYFWNMLDKHFYELNLFDDTKEDYFDELSDDDIEHIINLKDSRSPYFEEHSDNFIDIAVEKAIRVMTPRQQIVWREIIDNGYSSSYDIAHKTGISRQTVNKHILNGLERVRTANLTVTDM